jgi:hypothetical protein
MKALKILNSLLRMDIWDKQRCNINNNTYIKEAIAELEELMKPKTCETCKHRWFEYNEELIKDDYCHMNEQPVCDDFYCNRYEPKG